jgi:hypothetical protein
MASEEDIKLFTEFLEAQYQNCLNQYKDNMLKCFGKKYSFDRFMKETEPKYLISSAFKWIQTPQGNFYWSGIDKTWQGYYQHETDRNIL